MFRFPSLTSNGERIPGYMTLCVGITLIGIGLSITRPYLSLFCTNVIHMTPAELGTFLCINAVGGIVASTWMAKLSDAKTPKKDIMWISAVCAGLGYVAFMVFHTYLILLIVSTVLLGLGSSTFPQMFAYAREATIGKGDATFAISTLRSFFSLAWVIGPLVGAWVLAQFSYNGLFTGTAIIFGVVMMLVVLRLQRRPSTGRVATRKNSLLADLKRLDVLLASIGFCFAFTASSMNATYMPLFVTRSLHAPEHVVGWVFSLSAGLEIPIMIGLGAVADRIGKRILLMVGSIAGTLYYLLTLLAQHAWEVLALQLLCATMISIYMSIGMSYFQDFMPDAPGSATTLYSNTSSLGGMVGSVGGGLIAQAFSFRSVYWTCAVLGLVSFLFLLRRKSRHSIAVPVPEAPDIGG